MKLDPIEGEYKFEGKIDGKKHKSNKSTKVVCPNCSNAVKANDINIQDKIAKCGTCNEVFSFENDLQKLLDYSKIAHKPVLGKQKNVEVLEYMGEFNITLTQFNDWGGMILFGAGIFGSLMSTVIYFKHGLQSPIGMFIIGIIFLYGLYRMINYKKNKFYVDVDDQYLYIKTRPKNFLKDKVYVRAHVKQFYLKQFPNSDYYQLMMLYDGPDGEEHVKIAPMMQGKSTSLYIEQELERFMGIEEYEVPDSKLPAKL